MAQKTEKKTPYMTFRSKNVSASIWENDAQTKDGKSYTRYSVTFDKSYKDKNDKWQTTNTLFEDEIVHLYIVVNEAMRFLLLNDEKKTE